MALLRLSVYIHAPIEDVYRHVTAFGADGPVSDEAFASRYGVVLGRDGDSIVVEEDVRHYPEDEPELVRWRCTFEYPTARRMDAVDSIWSDRYDSFRSEKDGTRWSVRWRTKIGGLHGAAQYIYFLLVGGRRMSREVFDPVRKHFA